MGLRGISGSGSGGRGRKRERNTKLMMSRERMVE